MLLEHPTKADSTLTARQLKRKFKEIEDAPVVVPALQNSSALPALPPVPTPSGTDAFEDDFSIC
eukprot:7720987-Pyramimonas_sp.AAC.1